MTEEKERGYRVALQYTIRYTTSLWSHKGQYHIPDGEESIKWVVIEAAEALDALMRMDTKWVRNHPNVKGYDPIARIAEELSDVVFMAMQAADAYGIDLEQQVRKKMLRSTVQKIDSETRAADDWPMRLEVR